MLGSIIGVRVISVQSQLKVQMVLQFTLMRMESAELSANSLANVKLY
jgi:hypothetical protein